MNVRVHAKLGQFFQSLRLPAPLLIWAGIGLLSVGEASSWKLAALLMAGCGALAAMLMWWRLPVECTRMGCPGRMRRTTRRVSFWRVRAEYRCDDCGNVHLAEMFDPNLEITGEYG